MISQADEDHHRAPEGGPRHQGGKLGLAAAGRTESTRTDELQHRVRNTLAVIRSVFSRTVANGTSLEDVADHFQGRLDTIAPFASGRGTSIQAAYPLEALVWDQLLRYPDGAEDRITVTGPPELLPHRIAQPLALAFHELITNAIKFGAFASEPYGRLRVDWRRERDELVIHWQESGIGIVAAAPFRSGFGREYIEQALPYQIGAETSLDLQPGGMRCIIRIRAASIPGRPLDAEELE